MWFSVALCAFYLDGDFKSFKSIWTHLLTNVVSLLSLPAPPPVSHTYNTNTYTHSEARNIQEYLWFLYVLAIYAVKQNETKKKNQILYIKDTHSDSRHSTHQRLALENRITVIYSLTPVRQSKTHINSDSREPDNGLSELGPKWKQLSRFLCTV